MDGWTDEWMNGWMDDVLGTRVPYRGATAAVQTRVIDCHLYAASFIVFQP